jgi:hypothetical protein
MEKVNAPHHTETSVDAEIPSAPGRLAGQPAGCVALLVQARIYEGVATSQR